MISQAEKAFDPPDCESFHVGWLMEQQLVAEVPDLLFEDYTPRASPANDVIIDRTELASRVNWQKDANLALIYDKELLPDRDTEREYYEERIFVVRPVADDEE